MKGASQLAGFNKKMTIDNDDDMFGGALKEDPNEHND